MNVDWVPDLEWSEWMPVFRKLAALALSLGIAYASGSHEVATKGELDTTASQANAVVKVEEILAIEYETIYEMIRYQDRHAAACDTTLEMYRGPDDIQKVIEECHSEGGIE